MERDYKALLLNYGYPEDLVNEWSEEDCEAEWNEFCNKIILE